jgi:pimeloyl-ACP methyl ester carboxylesterase
MRGPILRLTTIVAATLVTSAAFAAGRSYDKQPSEPLGRQKLHMSVEGNSRPVVVLEAGFASDSRDWVSVQPKLAKFSTAVSYDRAGLGQSPGGTLPRTAKQIANDLHGALQHAGLKPPYVLVAHSAGALYTRVFAHLYPTDVQGMILVDPAPPGFYAWFKHHNPKAWDAMTKEVATSSMGAKQELDSLGVSITQARAAWPLPSVPVYILVATRLQPPFKDDKGLRVWISMQQHFCHRLPKCTLIRDSKSGHNMPMDDPALIVSYVRKITAL